MHCSIGLSNPDLDLVGIGAFKCDHQGERNDSEVNGAEEVQ